jgi:uncharacterized protein YdeI (YjbR/CyaY-like superfamily)
VGERRRPRFFATPAQLRSWLEKNHASASELLVGFFKRASGKPSITWPESVDEALCFGWIDGIRRGVDDRVYTIRFTPRRPGSVWSAVNIARARRLARERRMTPAGLEAFEARRENRSGVYSYEQRRDRLEEPYASLLARNSRALRFFEDQPPSYRKVAGWWVVGAKKEETRLKRLSRLIEASACGRRVEEFEPSRRSRPARERVRGRSRTP